MFISTKIIKEIHNPIIVRYMHQPLVSISNTDLDYVSIVFEGDNFAKAKISIESLKQQLKQYIKE